MTERSAVAGKMRGRHSRRARLSLATAGVLAIVALANLCLGNQARAGEMIDFGDGTPPYKLFLPSKSAGPSTALVVMLHGCEQDATTIATGTKWNALAENHGFYVLYANQERGRNMLNCWNWFLPGNQQAGRGEPAVIMAAIDRAQSQFPIDRRKVYVAGMSAGGAMAAILLSCYPDRFAAGAISAGLPYGMVEGVGEAFRLMANGPAEGTRVQAACDPGKFHGGVIVVQGMSDQIVNPKNADRLLADFVPANATKWQTTDMPAIGQSLGYHLTNVVAAGRLVAQRLLVERADHAWIGGTAGMPYCDPHGPNATEMIWSFFSSLSWS